MTNPSRGIELGSVTSSSGRLLIIDMGLLPLWSGPHKPVMNDRYGRVTMEAANSGSDYEIQGPDALKVGRALGLQWHPRFLYDIPAAGQADLSDRVDKIAGDAQLVRLASRVPHEDRLEAALEFGGGVGVVQYHGVPAVAIDTKVRHLRARVVATPDEHGRWRRVSVLVADGAATERHLVGHVGVDEARLCVAEPIALRAWEHEEPVDGLADLVFWGRDADQLAARFLAPHLGNETYGWQDIPVAQGAERGLEIEDYLQEHTETLKARLDFRPHSHHYQVLRQIWDSEEEAGQLDVGGERLTGFMTKCGDGFFPVYVETSEHGVVLAVTIDLAASGDVGETAT